QIRVARMNAAASPSPLTDKRILVTGVTGMVAGPMAARLAGDNTVFGAARFADPAQRDTHEAAGITTIRVDLEHGELDEVPNDLDDIVASLPHLLASASTPANVVNWGGDEIVSVEEWCGLIGDLIGKPVRFEHTDASVPPLILDVGKLNDLGFHSSVSWKDGI